MDYHEQTTNQLINYIWFHCLIIHYPLFNNVIVVIIIQIISYA